MDKWDEKAIELAPCEKAPRLCIPDKEEFCYGCYHRPFIAAELRKAGEELETLQMQLAGCGVAAMCNTEKSIAEQRIGKDNPYWSASYGDVCRAVDREIELRAARAAALAQVEELREANKDIATLRKYVSEYEQLIKAARVEGMRAAMHEARKLCDGDLTGFCHIEASKSIAALIEREQL